VGEVGKKEQRPEGESQDDAPRRDPEGRVEIFLRMDCIETDRGGEK